jgi:hypothetical protein
LKNIPRYGIYIFCLFCLGCSCNRQKRLDRRVSLWHLDKIPYGTKYAFDNLSYIFPYAEIRTSSRFPDLFQHEGGEDTIRTLIIISPQFAPEANEMNSIIRFAASGNQVFISALEIEDTVLNLLHLKSRENLYAEGDSTEVSLLDPVHNEWEKFTYPGYSLDPYFETVDSLHTSILGRDNKGKPDFIRVYYANGGAIFIHLNPLVFSNFFLLHGGNKSFYDLALSWLPRKTGVVEWSDYFRYTRNSENFSALRFILSKRSLRWAFWLTLILFLLMFLIESKRKQRPITEIPALRNASEDFVKTVGRLYFQQKNNQNLAAKMVTAFLENIRTSYNLPTSTLNDEFAHKLAFRAGRPVNEINSLIQLIHESRLNPELSDQELMDLHQQINQFNKPA